jgi:hypothetical protein
MAKYSRFAKVYENCFPTLADDIIDIIHSFAPIMGSFLPDIQKVDNRYVNRELNLGRPIDWCNRLIIARKNFDEDEPIRIETMTCIRENFSVINTKILRSVLRKDGKDELDVPIYDEIYPNRIRMLYSVFMEKGMSSKIDTSKEMLLNTLFDIAGESGVKRMLEKPKLRQMLNKISKKKISYMGDLTQPQLVYLLRCVLMKY